MPAPSLARIPKLTEGRLLAYSSGNFGKNLVFGGADATILFLLTDLFDVAASVAGGLMLAALLGDLVFDLVAAALVIRARRAGRGYGRLVAVAALPAGAAFALLYAAPALGVTQAWAFAGMLVVFRGAYALIDVPHNAMMTQVSGDSRTRGRISGYRLFFSTAASLAVAAILTPTVQAAAEDRAFGALALVGLAGAALFALTLIGSAMASGSAREEPDRASTDGILIPLNDPLVLAIGAIGIITGLAAPSFVRMLLYTTNYVIEQPGIASALLIAIAAGQFLGVLLWTALTGQCDKSKLLAAGHGVTAIGVILFAVCLASPATLIACAVLIGIGLTSVYMLPWGLLANIVEFVAWRHGKRLETGMFAAYLVVVKASGAASTALIGWCLGWLGYAPGADQTETVRIGMLALALGLPLAGSLAAILLLRQFDIGHARHASVTLALARRQDRRTRTQAGAEPVSGL